MIFSILFIVLVLLHAGLHVLGFMKSRGMGPAQGLKLPVSRSMGSLWLAAAFSFIPALVFKGLGFWFWAFTLFPAIMLSQFLVIRFWRDARAGTVPNVLLLLLALASAFSSLFEQGFRNDVHAQWQEQKADVVLTESDLQGLPLPVQRYIRVTGCVGKPRVHSMRVRFEGRMREKGKEFFSFRSEQYNSFTQPARLFFMKAHMFGLTVPGYHRYLQAKASMDVRLFGLFPVAQFEGAVMDTTETVTLFNDMCLLAPASLIDPRIHWTTLNDSTADAAFTNEGITVKARLFFGADGLLRNFVSYDRTAMAEGRRLPFSTPVHSWQFMNGFRVLDRGDAVWTYDDGPFTYGEFKLVEITYNPAP